MKPSRTTFLLTAGLLTLACAAVTQDAQAQFAPARLRPGQTPAAPLSRTEPVGFTADEVHYDRERGIVTATGNVEAWQNDHVLRADTITFDRNTDVAAASGHVWIVEPDGQVLFSDYAELTQGMREGVIKNMSALLAENGRLVANGVRRTGGKINEMSRAVYSTCNLCQEDPSKAPLWQIRARDAVQDQVNKRIEYRDAVVDIYGVPVAWFPYFWHVDPSVRRASGFLIPSYGNGNEIGTFVQIPYYWAIDEQSDATFVGNVNTGQGFNLDGQYRRRFNDGTLDVNLGVGWDQGKPQAAIFAKGTFAYDDTWRYGFDINRATSSVYLRDYKFTNHADVLATNIYLEGFGTGAYSRLDALAYQGLVSSISQARLPYVLPRYKYSYFGEPDALGGRFSLDSENFNVLRQIGTNTQRVAASMKWERPFDGALGEQYNVTVRTDVAGYNASTLDQNPNYYTRGSAATARAQPNVALDMRWPFVRESTSGWGRQIIEPIVQAVAGPNAGGLRKQAIPNEDSLDFEFTDQNLFAINKFPGIDRQEGGLRLNAGLHYNWSGGGMAFDQLVGQSYRTHAGDTFPVGSGLDHRASDVVTRTTFAPTSWLDVTGRSRLDRRNLSLRFADVQGSAGTNLLRLSAGYLYSDVNPYFYYDQATVPASYYRPRNELLVGATGTYDKYRFSAYGRRDLALNKMVAAGVRATYEDECFIFDANLSRRYTSLNGDSGATLVLFQITFKTVGQFGFHAF